MSQKDFTQVLQDGREFQHDSLELIKNWSMLVDNTVELDVTFELFNGETHVLPNVLKVINSFNAEFITLQDQIDAINVTIATIQNDINQLTIITAPVGAIVPYVGTIAPTNWLLCNGAPYDTIQYAGLFAVWPFTVVPDMKDKFLMGASAEADAQLHDTRNNNTHFIQESEMPAHTHEILQSGGHTHTGVLRDDVRINGGTTDGRAVSSQTTNNFENASSPIMLSDGNHIHNATSVGGGQPFDKRPRYLVVNYIIRAL